VFLAISSLVRTAGAGISIRFDVGIAPVCSIYTHLAFSKTATCRDAKFAWRIFRKDLDPPAACWRDGVHGQRPVVVPAGSLAVTGIQVAA
jgi:hypothetical protein